MFETLYSTIVLSELGIRPTDRGVNMSALGRTATVGLPTGIRVG